MPELTLPCLPAVRSAETYKRATWVLATTTIAYILIVSLLPHDTRGSPFFFIGLLALMVLTVTACYNYEVRRMREGYQVIGGLNHPLPAGLHAIWQELEAQAQMAQQVVANQPHPAARGG